jgi:hypothetical protein
MNQTAIFLEVSLYIASTAVPLWSESPLDSRDPLVAGKGSWYQARAIGKGTT